MKNRLNLAVFCLAHSPAFAQDTYTFQEVAAIVSHVPYEQCAEAQKRFRDNVDQDVEAGIYSAYLGRHAIWAVELICEASRYRDVEIPRVQIVHDRLVNLAEETEAKWASDHLIDPVKFPDYLGRDASQQQNLADARRQLQTIKSHQAEMRKILGLGEANWEIILANDPRAAADLVRRLLGDFPLPTA